MLQPIPSVAQQGRQSLSDFIMGNTNVLFCGSIHPGPPRRLIEHAQMEISDVGLDKRFMPAKIVRRKRPRV